MKIGIVLEQRLHSGGGFQQALNAIRQLIRICPSWMTVEVFTTVAENAAHPSLQGVSVRYVRRGLLERLRVMVLAQSSPLTDSLVIRTRPVTKLEREMIAAQVDLAYFAGPSSYALAFRSLSYVLTVWDLCHRDHPEFPEVSENGEFVRRENLYRHAINRSFLTLTDSEELSRRAVRCYGTDSSRLLAMPFQPAAFFNNQNSVDLQSLSRRMGLPENYLFYPAQFWPHKNHIRIVQALALLKEQGKYYSAVFCGGEQSNKAHVKTVAEKLGVADQILFTGFVDEQDMRGLYSLSKALVMPTYFGPTNLPPLEAWGAGKPVIYSILLSEQVGDGALCVSPDSAFELAAAIERIYDDNDLQKTLVSAGYEQLKKVDALRFDAELRLLEKLEVFNNRRACWGTVQ